MSVKEQYEKESITIEVNGRKQTYEPKSAMHDKFLREMIKEETEEFNIQLASYDVMATNIVLENEELFNNSHVQAVAFIAELDDEGNIIGWNHELRRHPSMVRVVNKLVQSRRTKEEIEEDAKEKDESRTD